MPAPQGFTKAQIIDLANRRTEKRGEKNLDLDSEFLQALQEFCAAANWHWKRVTGSFSTVAGTPTYDLGALDEFTDVWIARYARKGIILVNPSGQTGFSIVNPLFNADEQALAIEATDTGIPNWFFPMPGTPMTIRLHPIPSAVIKVRVIAWCEPAPLADSQQDTIPLVPPHLHHLIQTKLETQILRYTLGKDSAAYVSAMQEYAAKLAKATVSNTDFADGRVKQIQASDDGDAIQSL